jgi:hypothetical protein
MTGKNRVLFLSSLAVAVLLLVFGCSLLLRDDSGVPAGDGWYIKLKINAPTVPKSITVSEYQVTGLQIEMQDPADEVLQTIDWEAADGAKSYLIPVNQLGEYEIEVTHIGEKNGQSVEATESAAFNIQAMVITVIDITPGCVGVIKVEPGGGEQHTYTLTVLSGGNGTTSPSGNITVDHGSATNISATPAANHQFVNWTVASGTGAVFGDANSSNTTVSLTAGDAIIQANFVVAKYVGIWFASNVETPGPAYVDAKITLNTDGTYETLLYNVGGSTLLNMSSRGTYTCANNIFRAQLTEQYNGSAWVLVSGTPPPAPYSVSEDGNTLIVFQDFDQNGTTDAIWTLTRQ